MKNLTMVLLGLFVAVPLICNVADLPPPVDFDDSLWEDTPWFTSPLQNEETDLLRQEMKKGKDGTTLIPCQLRPTKPSRSGINLVECSSRGSSWICRVPGAWWFTAFMTAHATLLLQEEEDVLEYLSSEEIIRELVRILTYVPPFGC